MQNINQAGLYLAVSIVLFIMMLLIYRKGSNLTNSTFMFSTLFFSAFSFMSFVNTMEFFGTPPVMWLNYIISSLFTLGPIGIFYSSLIILHGDYYIKNKKIILFSLVYILVMQIAILIPIIIPDLINLEGRYFTAINDYSVMLLTGLTTMNFYKISNSVEEIKKNMQYLVIGMSTATIGVFIVASLKFLQMSTIIPIGLGIILIGLFFSIYAFISRPQSSK